MPSTQPLLADWFAHVYRPQRLLGRSPGSVRNCQILIRHLTRFLGRPAIVADLTTERIAAFCEQRLRGCCRATVWREQAQLIAFARHACRRRSLREVPDVAPIRLLRKSPTTYSPAEIGRLLAAARAARGEISSVPSRLVLPALVLIVYDTGCRASPPWELQWPDWVLAERLLLFRAEYAKQRTDQLLRVSSETADAIERLRGPQRETILPRLSETMRWRWVKAMFAAAGLPSGRHDQLQRIRRTTATLMYRAGGDPTVQLGHSSPSVTRRHYLDVSGQPQAADLLPRPIMPATDPQQRLF